MGDAFARSRLVAARALRNERTLGAAAVLFLGLGLLAGDRPGAFVIGIGAAYVLFIVQTAIFTKRRLLAVGHGRYASRRLVVSDGEAWEHTRAGSNRLNADTIKGTARGKRALFLDHDAGGKVVIPLEVADDPSVHDALLAAIARSTPADAPPR